MKYGFTGTQKGMTAAQRKAVLAILQSAHELHHGDCVGADHDAHRIARLLNHRRHGGVFMIRIWVHPPDNSAKRAFSKGDIHMPPAPYRTRNEAIVRSSEVLIACPGNFVEEQRSGTWMTVRIAEREHVPITIVWPDGRVEEWRR